MKAKIESTLRAFNIIAVIALAVMVVGMVIHLFTPYQSPIIGTLDLILLIAFFLAFLPFVMLTLFVSAGVYSLDSIFYDESRKIKVLFYGMIYPVCSIFLAANLNSLLGIIPSPYSSIIARENFVWQFLLLALVIYLAPMILGLMYRVGEKVLGTLRPNYS